ncbi:MAG TPA: alanine racemase [Phycisphaerae bacterium]|nr:alanine racemase [Phycisphaerae bacterium]
MRSDLLAIIDTQRLVQNFRALKACSTAGVKLCAPLKANAYGHGIDLVAPALYDAGADEAAVATIVEALELRRLGWDRPILVLGNILSVADESERRERLAAVIRQRLTLTITDETTVGLLLAAEPTAPIDVHLKIDTGMGRMGVAPERALELIQAIRSVKALRLTGIYSHFATADLHELDLAGHQLATFRRTLTALSDFLPRGVTRHLANSAATISMPEAHFDMVRPGLALYGYLPAEHMAERIALRPILRLETHLTAVKELPSGHCVGYGQTFTTRRPTRLGIAPIGYFDGFLRALSNAAIVSTDHGDAPIVGRISMDQLAVDLTDLPPVVPGTAITLISDDPARPNSVAAIARRLGTIPYEVTCLLGQRIDRVAKAAS